MSNNLAHEKGWIWDLRGGAAGVKLYPDTLEKKRGSHFTLTLYSKPLPSQEGTSPIVKKDPDLPGRAWRQV
jgi:hypothetical protein